MKRKTGSPVKKILSKSSSYHHQAMLPYCCKEVLELYASSEKDVDRIERLEDNLKQIGIISEIYYSNQKEIAYATLVVFLPDSLHVECSKFSVKTFCRWHERKNGE